MPIDVAWAVWAIGAITLCIVSVVDAWIAIEDNVVTRVNRIIWIATATWVGPVALRAWIEVILQ